jgi:tRNA(Arg) A34 adenosine deaminase TadA
MERLTDKQVLSAMMSVMNKVVSTTKCMRRATACVVVTTQLEPFVQTMNAYLNGPLGSHVCTGIKGGCGCCHAEMRAVVDMIACQADEERAIQDRGPLDSQTDDYELWSFLSPCSSCANLIIAAKLGQHVRIDRVVYVEELEHDQLGKRILRGCGIDVVKADR